MSRYRMNQPRSIAFILGALALCIVTGTVGLAPVSAQQRKQPHRLIIQFEPDQEEEAEVVLGLNPGQAAGQGHSTSRAQTETQRRLSEKLKRYQIKKVKRLNRQAQKQARQTKRMSRRQKQRLDKRAARLARRAKRAPKGLLVPEPPTSYVLELDAGVDIEEAARELMQDPAIRLAISDQPVVFDWIPNEPLFQDPNGYLWHLYTIGMPAAWDISRGATAQGEPVLVALIDTGVNPNHYDLQNQLWVNPNEDLNGNGVIDGTDTCPIPNGDYNCADDDENGLVDDLWGWDFVHDDNDPTDGAPGEPAYEDDGHGTHVGGTIAALGNNGQGIIGVAPEVKLMVLKMHDVSHGASAIYYAVDQGAEVINTSWRGTYFPPLESALAYAASQGVLVVAASGNEGASADAKWPCADPMSVCVSASDQQDQFVDFSNTGEAVDLAAPGVGIASLGYDLANSVFDGVTLKSGTSMATPHVTGVAALLLAQTPTLTLEQLKQLFWNTSEDIEAETWDPQTGFGLLSADEALLAQPPVAARITNLQHSNTFVRPVVSSGIGIEGKVENQLDSGALVDSWQLTLSEDGTATTPTLLASGNTEQPESPLASLDPAGLTSGAPYTLRLGATALNGQASFDLAKLRIVEPSWSARQLTDTPPAPDGRSTVSVPVSISSDGQTILFRSTVPLDPSLDPGDTVDQKLFLYHRDRPQPFEFLMRGLDALHSQAMSGDASSVAFSSALDLDPSVGNPDGVVQLFWMNAANRVVHQATTFATPGELLYLRMDELGQRIVFVRGDNFLSFTGHEVLVYDRQTDELRQITSNPTDGYAVYDISGDGTRLVYVHLGASENFHLYDIPAGQDQVVNPCRYDGALLIPEQAALLSGDGSRVICTDVTEIHVLVEDPVSGFVVEDSITVGERVSLVGLSDDVSRFLVASRGNLDPLGGNPDGVEELFVLERATGQITQVTYGLQGLLGQLYGGATTAGADAAVETIAVTSNETLDPQSDNSDGSTELFLFVRDPQRIQIDPVSAQTVTEGWSVQFTVRAIDLNGEPISWVASWATEEGTREVGEVGASFADFDDGTGEFTWLPWFGQSGDYEFNFVATTPSGKTTVLLVPITVEAAVPFEFDDELVVTGDAFVQSYRPDRTKGLRKRLKARFKQRVDKPDKEDIAYVKFDISPIHQALEGEHFAAVYAQLCLYSKRRRRLSPGGANEILVAQTDPNWREETLTYNTRPAALTQVPELRTPGGQKVWHCTDVTAMDLSGSEVSFQLKAFERRGVRYVSKERLKRPERWPRLSMAVAPVEPAR